MLSSPVLMPLLAFVYFFILHHPPCVAYLAPGFFPQRARADEAEANLRPAVSRIESMVAERVGLVSQVASLQRAAEVSARDRAALEDMLEGCEHTLSRVWASVHDGGSGAVSGTMSAALQEKVVASVAALVGQLRDAAEANAEV